MTNVITVKTSIKASNIDTAIPPLPRSQAGATLMQLHIDIITHNFVLSNSVKKFSVNLYWRDCIGLFLLGR